MTETMASKHRLLAVLAAMFVLVPHPSQGAPREYLLSLSWDRGFCETPGGRSTPRCYVQQVTSFAATHLSLTGLSPMPEDRVFCLPESQRYQSLAACDLPKVKLPQELALRLPRIMPSSMMCLDRYEWFRHGTCSELDVNNYFRLAFDLVNSMTETRFSRLLTATGTKTVTRKQLCDAVHEDFGATGLAAITINIADRPQRNVELPPRHMLVGINLHLQQDDAGKLTLDTAHLAPQQKPAMECDDWIVDLGG